MFRSHSLPSFFIFFVAFSLLSASSAVETPNAATWTGDDVYQLLHSSPWTKIVKVKMANIGPIGGENQNPGSGPNQMPNSGMSRRGMAGGRSRTYSSGNGSSNRSPVNPDAPPAQVTVQWQSAVPIQIAAAKKAGERPDLASFKPLDDYVVALIGLPAVVVGGRAASADSEATTGDQQQELIKDRVKNSASLLRSGHPPINAVKVELDQGFDGRMLIYFPKTDPITSADKTVEFRLTMGKKKQLRRKFDLKDMDYQGKLAL